MIERRTEKECNRLKKLLGDRQFYLINAASTPSWTRPGLALALLCRNNISQFLEHLNLAKAQRLGDPKWNGHDQHSYTPNDFKRAKTLTEEAASNQVHRTPLASHHDAHPRLRNYAQHDAKTRQDPSLAFAKTSDSHVLSDLARSVSNGTRQSLDEAAVISQILEDTDIERFAAIARKHKASKWRVLQPTTEAEVHDYTSPILVAAKSCWNDAATNGELDEDSVSELGIRAAATSETEIIVRGAGSRYEAHWSASFNQLIRPDPEEPIHACNIRPSKACLRQPSSKGRMPSMKLPFAMDGHFDLRSELDLAFNLTPEGTIIDVHSDRGLYALSAAIGVCEKVWFFWPPSDHNLAVFAALRATREDESKLLRCQELRDGLLCILGHSQAVLIPPGWLHATLTLTGGVLSGCTFCSPKDHGTIELTERLFLDDVNAVPADIWTTGQTFLDTNDLALHSSEPELRKASVNILQGFAAKVARSTKFIEALGQDEGGKFLKHLNKISKKEGKNGTDMGDLYQQLQNLKPKNSRKRKAKDKL